MVIFGEKKINTKISHIVKFYQEIFNDLSIHKYIIKHV